MKFCPIQTLNVQRLSWSMPEQIVKKAYDVYSNLYNNRQTLEALNNRGGFHIIELLAFLYAASFPKELWREKVDEALMAQSSFR